jgi:hypothetical protein
MYTYFFFQSCILLTHSVTFARVRTRKSASHYYHATRIWATIYVKLQKIKLHHACNLIYLSCNSRATKKNQLPYKTIENLSYNLRATQKSRLHPMHSKNLSFIPHANPIYLNCNPRATQNISVATNVQPEKITVASCMQLKKFSGIPHATQYISIAIHVNLKKKFSCNPYATAENPSCNSHCNLCITRKILIVTQEQLKKY